jgi:hypothetical protein
VSDPFFTPPTLADLIDSLREQDAAFKEARQAFSEAERRQLNAKLALDAAKTGLACAERAVVEYVRKHGMADTEAQ